MIFWQLHIKIQQDLQGLVGGVTGLFGSAKPKDSTYSAPTYSTKPSTPKLKIPKLPTLKLPETPYGKPPVSNHIIEAFFLKSHRFIQQNYLHIKFLPLNV